MEGGGKFEKDVGLGGYALHFRLICLNCHRDDFFGNLREFFGKYFSILDPSSRPCKFLTFE